MKHILMLLAITTIVCHSADAQVRRCACKIKIDCRAAYPDDAECFPEPSFQPDPNVNSTEAYVHCGSTGCSDCSNHTGSCSRDRRGERKIASADLMIMHYKPENVKNYKVCKDEDGRLVCCQY